MTSEILIKRLQNLERILPAPNTEERLENFKALEMAISYITMYDASIRANLTHGAWKCAKDNKPPEGQNVLVSDIDGDIYMAYYSNGRKEWVRCVDYEKIKCVLAWQPLPKPYEEGAGQ